MLSFIWSCSQIMACVFEQRTHSYRVIGRVAVPDPGCFWTLSGSRLFNLSYDRGGALCARHFLSICLLNISPLDQTLRPTCKFLILGIFYHTIFFSSKNFVFKKFYYINSLKFWNLKKNLTFFFVKIIEKVIRLCTVLKNFFLVVVVKIGPYYGHFSRFFRSKLSIYLQNYVRNGLIFKTANQIFFFQHSA